MAVEPKRGYVPRGHIPPLFTTDSFADQMRGARSSPDSVIDMTHASAAGWRRKLRVRPRPEPWEHYPTSIRSRAVPIPRKEQPRPGDPWGHVLPQGTTAYVTIGRAPAPPPAPNILRRGLAAVRAALKV